MSKQIQIIFNIFRQRPAELFFQVAKEHQNWNSGTCPTGIRLADQRKLTPKTTFEETDHRAFNLQGKAFDRGETFAGVDYQTGLKAVDQLRPLVPANTTTMAQFALRWILMFDAVSCAIPGAKRTQQVQDNAAAADLPPLNNTVMSGINKIYNTLIREQVHHRW